MYYIPLDSCGQNAWVASIMMEKSCLVTQAVYLHVSPFGTPRLFTLERNSSATLPHGHGRLVKVWLESLNPARFLAALISNSGAKKPLAPEG